MTELESMQYITSRFSSLWVETSVEYLDMRLQKDSLSEWVRFSTQSDKPARIGYGEGVHRMGEISVQIFTKERRGVNRGLTLAQLASDIFNLHRFGGLVFGPCEVRIIGNTDNGGLTADKISWFQINVGAAYSFIE